MKSYLSIAWFSLPILGGWFFPCPPRNFAAERFPLGPGMRWTYTQVETDRETVEVSMLVDQALGKGLFHLQPSTGEEGSLVQVEGEKVYAVTPGPLGSVKTLMLDFAATEGSKWSIFCAGGDIVLESTSLTVTVPAGEFKDCYVFRTEFSCIPGIDPVRSWYAPGVGRVKSELLGFTRKVTEELSSFEPLGAFLRGDANGDNTVDLSDSIAILSWLFLGEAGPACEESADADGNGALEITDAITILYYRFLGGEPPPPPFPESSRAPIYNFPWPT